MNELENLKKDIKNESLSKFYIFYGAEDYMKNFYVKKIENLLIDDAFKSFNLEKFDEISFNLQDFSNAVDSLPAFAEKKLIIIRDFDLFKMKTEIKDQIIEILSDLPDYLCVIFDYATIEFKQDKRQKINNVIKENGEIVEFNYLSQKEINLWIEKKFQAENLTISSKTCEYFTFICSMSMSNLTSESQKLLSICENEVTNQDIDKFCSKVLEAKIFDVTDKIIKKDILSAQKLIDDLIFLKTDEFSIVSVINSQFQRFYSGKLGLNQQKSDKFYMDLWSIRSSYAIKINLEQARKLDLEYLRKACNLCAKATIDMVSLNIDKSEILQLLIVKLGAINA